MEKNKKGNLSYEGLKFHWESERSRPKHETGITYHAQAAIPNLVWKTSCQTANALT